MSRKIRLLLPLLVIFMTGSFAVYKSTAASENPKEFVGMFKVARANFLKEGPKPEDMPVLKAHLDYWQKYTDEGVCLLFGHTLNNDESAFGIVIVKADSEKTAHELMDADPMIKAGIVSVTVLPFEGIMKTK
ncbi:MAG TPA: YciI family protein [Pyrinomonadaceae bacterium]